jgi:hypothetical protein
LEFLMKVPNSNTRSLWTKHTTRAKVPTQWWACWTIT